LGNIRLSYQDANGDGDIDVTNDPMTTEIVEENNYYPFGLEHKGYNDVVSANVNSVASKFGFQDVEFEEALGLNLHEMDLRQYDPAIARWTGIDPVTHYEYSTYTAFDNNPVFWADPSGADSWSYVGNGMYRNDRTNEETDDWQRAINDTQSHFGNDQNTDPPVINVYVFDKPNQPNDNYRKANYTALIFVEVDGYLYQYTGSSYPDSKRNEDETEHNTVAEGEHDFNNESGHKGGTQKGLNVVDGNGNRNAPGKDPDGNDVTMQYVNVHTGYKTRRYSEGCPTICPSDYDGFTSHFNWDNGKTGNSQGSIFIYRGTHPESLNQLNDILTRYEAQNKAVQKILSERGY
ncbi:MAG: RHS repeat-associated core domain-containing protein, partial [Flavobacteriaceae bacterium]